MTYVRFSPRRPIKSFQDLEVYQKLLNVAVTVTKRLESASLASQGVALRAQLRELVLSLPLKIAEAHSWRFSDKVKGLAVLEEVMLGCNRAVVLLELVRDLDVPVPKLPAVEDGETTEVAKSAGGQAAATADSNIGSGSASERALFFEEQIKNLQITRWKVMHLARSWEKFSQTP